jgi:hypothetical protein
MIIVPIFLPRGDSDGSCDYPSGGSSGYSGGGGDNGAAGIPLVIVAMLAVFLAPIIIAVSHYFHVRIPIPGLYDVWPIQSIGDFIHAWIWMSFDLWFWGCLGVIGLMLLLLVLTPLVGLIQLSCKIFTDWRKNKGGKK